MERIGNDFVWRRQRGGLSDVDVLVFGHSNAFLVVTGGSQAGVGHLVVDTTVTIIEIVNDHHLLLGGAFEEVGVTSVPAVFSSHKSGSRQR